MFGLFFIQERVEIIFPTDIQRLVVHYHIDDDFIDVMFKTFIRVPKIGYLCYDYVHCL